MAKMSYCTWSPRVSPGSFEHGPFGAKPLGSCHPLDPELGGRARWTTTPTRITSLWSTSRAAAALRLWAGGRLRF